MVACGGTSAGGSQAQGGQGGASCPPGSEGCACYPNDTCDAGLTCATRVCVNLGSGGSGGQGGATQGGVPAAGASTGGVATGGAALTGGSNAVTGGTGGAGGNTVDGGDSTCNGAFTGLSECGTVPTRAQVVPAHILIVLDKSGSMSQGGLGSSQTKWQAVNGALRNALPELAPYAEFGLELFPAADVPLSCGTSCCRLGTAPDVDLGAGTTTVPEILALLDPNRSPAIGPGGNTPTADALGAAYQYLQNHPISSGATDTGKQLVFLVTDGGPNCNPGLSCGLDHCTTNLDHATDPAYQPTVINWCDGDPLHDGPALCLDDAATVQQVQNLRSLGVRIAVIGIPGSEPYQAELNALALAGGQQYYQVTSPEQLTQVFIQTASELITSCSIYLDQAPPEPAKVNVAIDCAVVSQVDGSGNRQWSIDTTSTPAELILQGALCERAKQSGLGRVDVLLGCPVI
jgi:Mg-chelatase subunit ChlD